METRIRLFGHSVHQMLIFLPIGLLAGSVWADLMYLSNSHPSWALMAFRLLGAGVVTGLIAAPFGFLDWLGIPHWTRADRIGKLHGIGNLVVLGLFTMNWFGRRGETHIPPKSALLFSFVGLGIVGVTAWLGGELVSQHGVGVSEKANLDAPSSLDEVAPPPAAPPSLAEDEKRSLADGVTSSQRSEKTSSAQRS